jgi:predicted RNA-binding protein
LLTLFVAVVVVDTEVLGVSVAKEQGRDKAEAQEGVAVNEAHC